MEEVEDGDARLLGPATVQVFAVGVDRSGPVGRRDAQTGGLGHAGVAIDGVHREAEAEGAVQQADALAGQGVDLVPAFMGGLFADTAGQRRVEDGGPAAGVCADLEPELVAQGAPQVPAVADLHRVGQGAADSLGIGGRAVLPGRDAGPLAASGYGP